MCLLLLVVSALSTGEVYDTSLRAKHAPAYYNVGVHNSPTSIHERTHWVNSRLRASIGRPSFYLGYGKYVTLPHEPRGYIHDVAQACQYKGGVYKLYLIDQQRDWDTRPSYLFDEWSCYLASAYVAYYKEPATWSDLKYALEFSYYCSLVPDSKELWIRMAKRTLTMSDSAKRENRGYDARQDKLREWLRKRLEYETKRNESEE